MPSDSLTVVLALDEGLPLPEPLHTDAVDDTGRLLGLERLVQLGGAGPRGRSVWISNTPPVSPHPGLLPNTRHSEKVSNAQTSSKKRNVSHDPTTQMTAASIWVNLLLITLQKAT